MLTFVTHIYVCIYMCMYICKYNKCKHLNLLDFEKKSKRLKNAESPFTMKY